MIFRISSISFQEVSGIATDCSFVRTGSTIIPFPRVSVDSAVGMSVGVITGIVTVLSTGVSAEMIVGPGVTFGGGATIVMITSPEIAFGGAISGEKILPLQVTLLVSAILLMSASSSLEFISLAAGQSCLMPW